MEEILRDMEGEVSLIAPKIFLDNFFSDPKNNKLEIAYLNFLTDILMYSKTLPILKKDQLFLCYAFKKITRTPIERLMEIERIAMNHIFHEYIDEPNLPHYHDHKYIYKYTARDAVRDGLFIQLGRFAFNPVYFTSNLYNQGYEDDENREKLLEKGIELLTQNDPEDTQHLKLRVIQKDKIWVTHTGEGITFMKPEDY